MKKMKKHSTLIISVLLLALSALIYSVQFVIFRDMRDTFFYFLQDWAFIPVQIVVVTIVVGRVISDREKRERIEKTKMLASAFFSELGTELMRRLLKSTSNAQSLAEIIVGGGKQTPEAVKKCAKVIESSGLDISCGVAEFLELKEFFAVKCPSLLIIASNPMLLEHEAFTDMLWSVFHLSDELIARGDLTALTQADLNHLNADAQRALSGLIANWLSHMAHIRSEYPYLFAFECRENALFDKTC